MADYYQQLLDIEEKQGYVMIIQFGQSYENGRLVSPVGMNVKAQDFYAELRDIVKSSFSCAVGSIMSIVFQSWLVLHCLRIHMKKESIWLNRHEA